MDDKAQEYLSDVMNEGFSNCCGAAVYDPLDNGQGNCMGCGEPCGIEYEDNEERLGTGGLPENFSN